MPDTAEPVSSLAPLSGIETLGATHDVSSFDCGNESLNEFLKRFALKNARRDSTRTYVVHRGGTVVGYFSLTPGSVSREDAPERVGRGLGSYPVGVVLIARFAVDTREQGKGLGAALLKDAFIRIEQAADIIGGRVVLVHAIDERARSFYEKYGFERCPVNELHLMLLMQDLRAALRASGL